MKFFKKYHKWIGIIVTLFVLLFAFSGIVLNHRNWFSKTNISRNILAKEYKYDNWNNAAVKGSLKINNDSILAYGNVGIWLTDSLFSKYIDFNNGFPKGIDNRKIYKIHKTQKGKLLAATLFGLYEYKTGKWEKIGFSNTPIMDLAEKEDTLLVLTRSFLLKTKDLKRYSQHTLPPPPDYNNKVSLFKTLWLIHSGEIFGHGGKLFTDFMGLVFIALSITGLIYFLAPNLIRRKKRKGKSVKKFVSLNRFSLKWHNKLGWTLILFLVLTTITGMFLRPPLLITIFSKQVNKIPFSGLDTENAWYDKLRRVIYDSKNQQYVFATIDGLFLGNNKLKGYLKPVIKQPPISVMGVNVFEKINDDTYLIGSFEGLFIWNKTKGQVWDYLLNKPYAPTIKKGPPIGRFMVAGYTNDFKNGPIFYDYNTGANPIFHNGNLPAMPQAIKNQPMSLWNFALEVHTMRIFNSLIGMFYLLIIPLVGLGILFVLISGFIVWYKKFRK